MIDCTCTHPYDAHDVTDDEYGPCYATANPNDPEGDCPCDAYEQSRDLRTWTRAWLDNGKRAVIDGDPMPPGRHLTIYRGQPRSEPVGHVWTLRLDDARSRAVDCGGVVLTSRVHRRLVRGYLTAGGGAYVIIDPPARFIVL